LLWQLAYATAAVEAMTVVLLLVLYYQ